MAHGRRRLPTTLSLALKEENRLAIGVLGAVPPLVHLFRRCRLQTAFCPAVSPHRSLPPPLRLPRGWGPPSVGPAASPARPLYASPETEEGTADERTSSESTSPETEPPPPEAGSSRPLLCRRGATGSAMLIPTHSAAEWRWEEEGGGAIGGGRRRWRYWRRKKDLVLSPLPVGAWAFLGLTAAPSSAEEGGSPNEVAPLRLPFHPGGGRGSPNEVAPPSEDGEVGDDGSELGLGFGREGGVVGGRVG